MDEAHAGDYADQRRFDELRRDILGWLAYPPERLTPNTRAALNEAVRCLKAESDHIVAVWD